LEDSTDDRLPFRQEKIVSDLKIQPTAQQGLYKNDRKSQAGGQGFGDFIKQAIRRASDMETQADQSVGQMLKGETGVHETMIAIQKADISLRFLLQVRNKVMESYREIMRMQF
jgi:flagellar hook-basal body complex protein FliE